ncbi:hypothetical protein PAEPH01_0195 [Pancytospora epiphaga]|nr:hypothetical protein PAEPH01_0195 [Pancytospora epiphaga]
MIFILFSSIVCLNVLNGLVNVLNNVNPIIERNNTERIRLVNFRPIDERDNNISEFPTDNNFINRVSISRNSFIESFTNSENNSSETDTLLDVFSRITSPPNKICRKTAGIYIFEIDKPSNIINIHPFLFEHPYTDPDALSIKYVNCIKPLIDNVIKHWKYEKLKFYKKELTKSFYTATTELVKACVIANLSFADTVIMISFALTNSNIPECFVKGNRTFSTCKELTTFTGIYGPGTLKIKRRLSRIKNIKELVRSEVEHYIELKQMYSKENAAIGPELILGKYISKNCVTDIISYKDTVIKVNIKNIRNIKDLTKILHHFLIYFRITFNIKTKIEEVKNQNRLSIHSKN